MALEQFHALAIAVALGGAGVSPRGPVVPGDRVNFRQRYVRIREGFVEPHRFEQQRQPFVPLPLHAIKLCEVEERPRIVRLALDPSNLFLDMKTRMVIGREGNHIVAPEAHVWLSSDQHQPDVHDVGVRRPGPDEVAQRPEEPI